MQYKSPLFITDFYNNINMKNRILLILIMLSFTFAFNAQVSVVLNKRGAHYLLKGFKKSSYVLKTYIIQIESYKLPKSAKKQSTFVYAVLSDSTLGCDYIKNKKYALVEYTVEQKKHLYVSDYEFDFSSCKKFEIDNSQYVDIEFVSKKENGIITISFLKNDYFELGAFGNESEKDTLADKKHFINFEYNNIKYGYFNSNNDSFYVGIFDIDNDGYLDKNHDFVFLSKIDSKYFFIGGENRCNKVFKDYNYLKIDTLKYYIIDNIDYKNGKVDLTLSKEPNFKNFNSVNNTTLNIIYPTKDNTSIIELFDELPNNLIFYNSKNQLITSKELLSTKKYIFIDIWTSFCQPCIKGIPTLDSISENRNEKLLIISLLDKDDDRSDLHRLIEKYKIRSYTGWSSDSVNYSLLLSGYPHGVLFNPDGELVGFYNYKELKNKINDIIDSK
jgi:thiol-disulfide isomerase/thioredoxin